MSGSVEKGNAPRLHHARLANTSRARQKARVKDGHTTHGESSFGKKLWCVLIVFFLGVIGWQMWKLNAYNNAVREAKAAGFDWQCEDTFSLIRQDWHNALKKETWGEHPRMLDMGEVPDLSRYREMLNRLRPTELRAGGCKDENLDSLKALTSLKALSIGPCTALQNLDALKDLTGLETLFLGGCTELQNLDAFKGLTGLREVFLSNCPALQNVDGLKWLTSLQKLTIMNCPALKNVDGLKSLTSLKTLEFRSIPGFAEPESDNSTRLSAASLRELRAALPNTDIYFPDGSKEPPQ